MGNQYEFIPSNAKYSSNVRNHLQKNIIRKTSQSKGVVFELLFKRIMKRPSVWQLGYSWGNNNAVQYYSMFV